MELADTAPIDADRVSRSAPRSASQIRVWDPLVRVFHWSLVTLFVVAWITGDEQKYLHQVAGYLVVGLIGFRLVWGAIGSRHARFADFLYRPATILGFLRDTIRLKGQRYLGHNPAGGVMVIALLTMLTVISATGIMMTTTAFWGVEWVEELHELSVDLTLALIVLHLVGVVIAGIEHRENLVRAMITGLKRAK